MSAPIELERREGVALVRMQDGENRFGPAFVAALHDVLDQIDESPDLSAAVFTGHGRFFSNGLDLAWMGEAGTEAAGVLLADVLRVFARILRLPALSLAAINGHAFAGGWMLALATDLRFMRTGRGYLCLPEADLGLPLHDGMTALIQARMPSVVAHRAVVTGHRFTAEEALAAGLLDGIHSEEELLPAVLEVAAGLAGKDRETQAALKRGLHPEVLRRLGDAPA